MMMDDHFTVQTESLTKDYGDGTSVRTLDDISFSIADGGADCGNDEDI